MADPRKAGDREPRDQFSISMKQSLHKKLEKLADMRHLTTSMLIERIVAEKLATIGDSTWDMIDKVREQLDKDDILTEPEEESPAPAARGKRGK